jgi:hypothetical protein
MAVMATGAVSLSQPPRVSGRRFVLEQRLSSAYFLSVMVVVLRRLVLVLTGFAFLVGATVQAMPLPASSATSSMQTVGDCAHMAMAEQATPSPAKAPCNAITVDCIKAMGCIGSPTIPARSDQLGRLVHYSLVAYWSSPCARTGLSIEPDLLPPIEA